MSSCDDDLKDLFDAAVDCGTIAGETRARNSMGLPPGPPFKTSVMRTWFGKRKGCPIACVVSQVSTHSLIVSS